MCMEHSAHARAIQKHDERLDAHGRQLDTLAETLAAWQGGAQGGDQPINIYIGEELLDSVIANSQNRRALRSGGR